MTVKVINLSSKSLNEHHISVLSCGPKFVQTPRGPDIMTLEKDIKVFVRLLKLKEFFHGRPYTDDGSLLKPPSDFTPNYVRNPMLYNVCDTLISTAENLQSLVPQKFVHNNLSYNMRVALDDLKSDDTILIKKADKGNTMVLLDKTFYCNKMLLVLFL